MKSNYTYKNGRIDWKNEYLICYSVESYLWRYDNYRKGINNEFILKSTFGISSNRAILEDIEKWYVRCIGAYSQIEFINC